MPRILIILLLPLLVSLSGCNQSSDQPAGLPEPMEQATDSSNETPMAEPEAPVAEVVEELADQVPTEVPVAEIPGLNLCTDPRPEICTQDYTPVCGVHEDGSRRTYSNGCTACSNAEVVGSLPGPCPE